MLEFEHYQKPVRYMEITAELKRQDVLVGNGEARETRVTSKFQRILDNARDRGVSIPPNAIEESHGRLNRILSFGTRLFPEEIQEFNHQGGEVNTAFLVHSRLYEAGDTELDDPGRCIPALSQKYGVPVELVDDLWRDLGPFEVGRELGKLTDGTSYHVSVVSVPITPSDLYSRPGKIDQVKYVRPRVDETIKLVDNLFGTKSANGSPKTIGLGETLASATQYGLDPQKKYPDFKFVTGHNVTTAAIVTSLEEGAMERDHDIAEEVVGLVGAGGSICSSVAEVLIAKGVGGLILHDIPGSESVLQNKVVAWKMKYPEWKGSVQILTGDDKLEMISQNVSELVTAAAVPRPIITREMIGNRKITILDDGQPPNVERPLPGDNFEVVVPLIVLPEHMNSFNTGQPFEAADYTCVAEAIMTHMPAAKSLQTVDAVTPERTIQAQELMKQAGYRVYSPHYEVKEATPLAA